LKAAKIVNKQNQVRVYVPSQNINIVIRDSPNQTRNSDEKEEYLKLIKYAALGLKKNYKNKSERTKTDTYDFQVKIAENMSGQTFALFLKHLNELKRDVIQYNEKEGIDI